MNNFDSTNSTSAVETSGQESNINKTAIAPNENDYPWVAFFKELATKLLDYKDKHNELINVVSRVSEKLGINCPINYQGQIIKDLDPFTFFATINRSLNKKYDLLCQYKDALGLNKSAPDKLNGVPERQNQKLWFTNADPATKENCQSVSDLWTLFDAAITLADKGPDDKDELKKTFSDAFDKCIKDGENVAWGATYGLFWIRPDFYVGLDSNMREFLKSKKFDIPKDIKALNGEKYLDLNGEVKEALEKGCLKAHKTIYALSAFVYGNKNKTAETINAIFDTKNGIKQVVLTGAPGTGKTYSAKEVAQNDDSAAEISSVDGIKYSFVQFHSSYDYSDFVEGLRPVQLKADGEPTFVRMDGTFKSFCRHAVEENYKEKNGDSIANITSDGSKEWYESFIEKYSAIDENELQNRYYFIIDEINRADLSKVFGELMYCLEYRGASDKIQTQYSNLKTYTVAADGIAKEIEHDCFEKGFFIPKNVYIIGTMNDIDRSVESFDFALRRRFKWIEVKVSDVEENILKGILRDDPKCDDHVEFIKAKLDSLNKYIIENENMGLSEAYQIGPAYFKGIDDIDGGRFETKIAQLFKNEIESILKEYVRGRSQSDIDDFLSGARKAFGLNDKYQFEDKKKKKTDDVDESAESGGENE